jgi:hypothetical protein
MTYMNNEYKLIQEDIRKQIKALIALRALTFDKLKSLVNEKYKKTDTTPNLHNKLSKKTIKLSEFIEIMDVLDFEIVLRDKK